MGRKRTIRGPADLLATYGLRSTGNADEDEATLKKSVYKATACGACVDLVRQDGRVVGVKLGSIVEGSQAEIVEPPLTFPFSSDDWSDLVNLVEERADYEWRLAHGELRVRKTPGTRRVAPRA